MQTRAALIGHDREWRAEMRAQWLDEDQGTGELEPSLRVAVEAARAYTLRELRGAFVFWDGLNDHELFGWCTDHQYRATSHQWVTPGVVLYGTVEGWYQDAPACVAQAKED